MPRLFIDSRLPGRVAIESLYSEKHLIESVPTSSYKGDLKLWHVAPKLSALWALRSNFGDRLVVDPEVQAIAWYERDSWHDLTVALAERFNLPELPDQYLDIQLNIEKLRGDPKPLKQFQEAGIAAMCVGKRLLQASEPGLGKTRMALTAMSILPDALPAIAVVPSGLKRTWVEEAALWAPGLRVSVCEGGAEKRRKAIRAVAEGEADLLVINYESLASHTRIAPYGSSKLRECQVCCPEDADDATKKRKQAACEKCDKELNAVQWQTIVIDEAHRAKEPSTKWTRAIWWLGDKTKYAWPMTGTPVANTIEDFWAMLRILSYEEYGSKWKFIERMADTKIGWHGGTEVGGVKREHEEEFRRHVACRMVRRLKSEPEVDVQIPDKLPAITRYVELPDKMRKIYNQMKDDLIAEVDSGDVVGWNSLTQLTRLQQFANASVVIQEDGSLRLCEPSPKLDELDETLSDIGPSESVVVFFASRQLCQMYENRLKERNTPFVSIHGDVAQEDRDIAKTKFQAKEVSLLLATLSAGAVGLTLTAAATVVFAQRSYSSIEYAQAQDRVHRIGQDRAVTIINLVTADTKEVDQMQALADKADLLEQVVQDKKKLRDWLAE